MDTLIVSLILAAVSGLTFLAYKHPRAYERVSKFLVIVAFTIYMGIFLWDMGIHAYQRNLTTVLHKSGIDVTKVMPLVDSAANDTLIPFTRTALIVLVIVVFIIGLRLLHPLINLDATPKEKD